MRLMNLKYYYLKKFKFNNFELQFFFLFSIYTQMSNKIGSSQAMQ
jgi:hypothetical protein